MCEANGLASVSRSNLHVPMVELISITESFYACGVAASMHGTRDECGGLFMSETPCAHALSLLTSTRVACGASTASAATPRPDTAEHLCIARLARC